MRPRFDEVRGVGELDPAVADRAAAVLLEHAREGPRGGVDDDGRAGQHAVVAVAVGDDLDVRQQLGVPLDEGAHRGGEAGRIPAGGQQGDAAQSPGSHVSKPRAVERSAARAGSRRGQRDGRRRATVGSWPGPRSTGWSAPAKRARSVTWWRAAFGEAEGVERIVDDLRTSDAWVGLSFVAEYEGRLVGHVSVHAEPPRRAEPAGRRPRPQPARRCSRPGRNAGSARRWSGMRCASSRSDRSHWSSSRARRRTTPRFGFVPGNDLGFRRPSRRIPRAAFQVLRLPGLRGVDDGNAGVPPDLVGPRRRRAALSHAVGSRVSRSGERSDPRCGARRPRGRPRRA